MSDDWSKLSPPEISAKQCQKLVDKYFQPDEPLAGRPVMIPFTNKQAFVMGELQPVTQKTANGDSVEHVQVRPGKDKSLQTLSTNDAKQWFLKKAQPTASKASAKVENPSTSSTSTMNKSESKSSNSTTKSVSGSKNATSRPQNQTAAPSIPFHPTMVEIHEEFNQDGTQTKGNVVNVASEFQALMKKMGQGDKMNFPGGTDNGDTKEEEAPEYESGDEIMTDYDAPLKQLTDPEYDQLAKRLDELARLEEMENERLQQGAWNAKLKAKRAAANKKKTSGGGWNKGFLNQPKTKKPAKKKASTATAQPTATTPSQNKPVPSPSSSSGQQVATADTSKNQAKSVSSQDSQLSPPVPSAEASTIPEPTTTGAGGGVAFDLSQNKVQEIPSLPGTRPIPPRNNVGSIPISSSSSSEPPRMMDSSVFSGVIQERPTFASGVKEVNSTGDGVANTHNSNAIQERSAPPQAFRRRRQQQQQQQTLSQAQDPNKPKKKLSRFAQERMG